MAWRKNEKLALCRKKIQVTCLIFHGITLENVAELVCMFFCSTTGYKIILWIRITRQRFPKYEEFFNKDSPASTDADWIIQSWVCRHYLLACLRLNVLFIPIDLLSLTLFYTRRKYLCPMQGNGLEVLHARAWSFIRRRFVPIKFQIHTLM